MSNTEYWKSLNEMLRNDILDFTPPKPANGETSVFKLTFKNVENLKKGIQYALDNPKVIAQLEYNFNDGQPIKITEKHLDRAKIVIQSEDRPVSDVAVGVNACSHVPIENILMNCNVLAHRTQSEYHILTDDKRKPLIKALFGEEFTEETSECSASKSKNGERNMSCTQIIFDSADVASAIHELLINLSDRTWSDSRIQSVYVQESLKNVIFDELTKEHLNASTGTGGVFASEEDKTKNEELAKQYGGKLICSDNNTICLMFDVPPKYLSQFAYKSFHQIPVAINFFRTTKEVLQLLKNDYEPTKMQYTSIWTENIGVFYEVAAEINSKVVWSNSIGLIDAIMLLSGSASKGNIRFKDLSGSISHSNIFQCIFRFNFQFGLNNKCQRKICGSHSHRRIKNIKISVHSVWKNIRQLVQCSFD